MLVVHQRNIRIASILLVMCVILTSIYFAGHARDTANLTVSVLDIGQGDSILINGPSDQQILVDTGPDRSVLAKLGEYMPFYDRDIELVIVTHPHDDHYGGLHEILNRYNVHQLYITGVNGESKAFDQLIDEAKSKGVAVQQVWRGRTVDMGPDIHLNILAPEKDISDVTMKDLNDSSIVAKLSYKQVCFMLTGDATEPVEKALLTHKDELACDVLKVAHHGSQYSSSDAFLDAVHPTVAAISDGLNNKFGHPHQQLLDRLIARSIKIFRTDQDGDIIFSTDGSHIDVRTSSAASVLPGISSTPVFQIH